MWIWSLCFKLNVVSTCVCVIVINIARMRYRVFVFRVFVVNVSPYEHQTKIIVLFFFLVWHECLKTDVYGLSFRCQTIQYFVGSFAWFPHFRKSSLSCNCCWPAELNLQELICNEDRWKIMKKLAASCSHCVWSCFRWTPVRWLTVTARTHLGYSLWTYLPSPPHFHIRVGLNYQKATLENASILLQRRLDPVGAEQLSLESRVRGFDVVFGSGLSEPFKCARFIPQLLSGFEVLMFHLYLSQYGSSLLKYKGGESKRERRGDELARQLLPVFKAWPSP